MVNENEQNTQQGIKLLFSGKLGSGKDAVALKVAEKLQKPSFKVAFAEGVRAEVNTVINIIKVNTKVNDAAEEIARTMNVNYQNAVDITVILKNAVDANPNLNANDRTQEMREALQYWGPTVRRNQNPCYWIDLALNKVKALDHAGNLIYITDGRFPNEIERAKKAGFITIRLETSDNVRQNRIYERDGKKPEIKAISHGSEIALDNTLSLTL